MVYSTKTAYQLPILRCSRYKIIQVCWITLSDDEEGQNLFTRSFLIHNTYNIYVLKLIEIKFLSDFFVWKEKKQLMQAENSLIENHQNFRWIWQNNLNSFCLWQIGSIRSFQVLYISFSFWITRKITSVASSIHEIKKINLMLIENVFIRNGV
jgi:hypothetical protein